MNSIPVLNRLASTIMPARRLFTVRIAAGVSLFVGAFFLGMWSASSPRQGALPAELISPQPEINALAVKLGELQAKLLRLDGFARQVGSKIGIEVAAASQPVALGGAAYPGQPLSAEALQRLFAETEQQLMAYQDQFALAEAALLQQGRQSLPVDHPVPNSLFPSSLFGARIDPFRGSHTFHEGVDFPGAVGTPIQAAGNGTVTFAGYHPEYGNMIDLDHGNGLVSRYAHNSRLKVRRGDTVLVGQKIALLGNSGRSTGPHLHFEIRYKNVPQNPLRFIATPDIVAGKTPAAMP